MTGKFFSIFKTAAGQANILYNPADATDDVIFSITGDRKLCVFNKAFAGKVFLHKGNRPKSGDDLYDCFPKNSLTELAGILEEGMQGHECKEIIHWSWTQGGEKIWAEVKAVPVHKKSRLAGLTFCMRDVSVQVQLERESAFNHDNLVQVLESSENIKIVFKNKKILFTNSVTSTVTGFLPTELLQLDAQKLFSFKDQKAEPEKAGDKQQEIILSTKKGKSIAAGVKFSSIRFKGVDCILATLINTTALTEEKKESILAHSSIDCGIQEMVRLDLSANIEFANLAFCNALGYTPEEIIGRHVSMIVPLFSQVSFEASVEQLKKSKGEVFYSTHIDSRGKTREVEAYACYDKNDYGEFVYTFIRDISDKKNQLRRLKKISKNLLALLDSIRVGILIYKNDQPIYVNNALCEILKCEKNDFLANGANYIHPEDRKMVVETAIKRTKGEFVPQMMEFRMFDTKGKVKHFLSWSEKIEYNETDCLLATLTDITELKNKEQRIVQSLEYEKQLNEELAAREEELTGSEEELRQNLEFQNRLIKEIQNREEFLNAVIDNLPLGFKVLDMEGNLLRTNNFQREIYKHAEIEFTDRYNILKNESAVATGLSLKFKEALNRRPVYDFEYTLQPKNVSKGIIYLSETIFPLKTDVGKITSVIVLCRDITDKKNTQRTILESQKRLSLATHSAGMGIWEWNRITDTLIWEDEVYAIFEAEKSENPIDIFNRSLYKEDLIKEQKNDRELLQTPGAQSHTVYRILTPSGATKYIESFAKTFDDEDLKYAGVIGISRDITHEQLAEQKLKFSEDRYRRLVEHAPEAIVVFNPLTGKLVDANDKACALFKMDREHLLQLGPADLSPPLQPSGRPSPELAQEIIQRALEGENPIFEWVHIDAKNNKIDAEVWLTQLPTEKGGYLVRGSIIDISERKRTELELRAVTQKMAEYKLMALRAVMNPHFIFNSLNSIQYFIAKNEREQAINYLSLFSKLIRQILESSVNTTVSLATELKILEYYLELENLRFENKFEVIFEIDEGVESEFIEVPSLFIQPYAENAVVHGLLNKNSGDGRLKIKVSKLDEGLHCIIEDNGIGRKAAKELKKNSHTSIGMRVTEERLETINQNTNISVLITDLYDEQGVGKGTRVELFLRQS